MERDVPECSRRPSSPNQGAVDTFGEAEGADKIEQLVGEVTLLKDVPHSVSQVEKYPRHSGCKVNQLIQISHRAIESMDVVR